MKINIADTPILVRTLMRKKKPKNIADGVDLGLVLKEILEWANKLVFSESGSILLDDPVLKRGHRKDERLYFTACFGKNSDALAGTSISIKNGIAGETYKTGKPYISEDVSKDNKFLKEIDKKTLQKTRSIICAPIIIRDAVIGVIELVNKKRRRNYDRTDLALLEIFAGYTATLIENALAAKGFEELSKRDNLTGLYNDRYFFVCLEHEVERALKECEDTSLILFDLDRFKEINDAHGHLAGSGALKEIADILRKIFHKTNAVLARYGGDEYIIILPGKDIDEAAPFAEAVRSEIEKNTFLSKRGSYGEKALNIKGLITASVGVASQKLCVTPSSNTKKMAEALMKAADRAMYRVKESGRNRVAVAGEEDFIDGASLDKFQHR